MRDKMTVFEFSGHFEGYNDLGDIQYRYVCAESEEEAYKKIEKYSKELKKNGFAKFIWNYNPIVHLDGVIA